MNDSSTSRADETVSVPRACTALGVIGEPMNGVGYVRFVQPFGRLAPFGFRLRTLGSDLRLIQGTDGYGIDPVILDGVSILIFPQLVASPVLEDGSRVEVVSSLCDAASRRGIPVIWSVDDWVEGLDEINPNYDKMQDSLHNLETIRNHAAAIVVTTEALAATLADWKRPTFVLPNTIDLADWKQRPGRPGPLRIGWAGSSTHLDDLLLVLPALARLRRHHPFEFTVFGLCDLPLARQAQQIERNRAAFTSAQRERADRFMEIYRRLRELSANHRPFVGTRDFMRTLPELDFDIGLCPLAETEFNRHKSALKFYEYAACGSLTVASDVAPYRGEVSVCATNDTESWVAALEQFLVDRGAREHELSLQREYVLEQRTIQRWAPRWSECLRSVLERSGAYQEGTHELCIE